MKKILILLLFTPFFVNGQHIKGTVNGVNTTISTEFLRYAVPNGSKTILVFDNRQNVIFEENILSVVAGSCGELYSTIISKKGNSFNVGDVVAPCVTFVNKVVQNGSGAILLTRDPSITFYVSTTYTNVNNWLTACSSGGGGSPTGVAGGDLNGTYPSPTVDGLQGRPLAATAPISGQAVIWNGTTWLPGTPTLAGGASGDLSGLYPSPTVVGLQGQPVSNLVPDVKDVLVFDGSEWVPSTVPYQHWFNTDLEQFESRTHDGGGFDFTVLDQATMYWQALTGIGLETNSLDVYSDIAKIRGNTRLELYTGADLELDIPTKNNPDGAPLIKTEYDGSSEFADFGFNSTGLADGDTWVYNATDSVFEAGLGGLNWFNDDLTQEEDRIHDGNGWNFTVNNWNALYLYPSAQFELAVGNSFMTMTMANAGIEAPGDVVFAADNDLDNSGGFAIYGNEIIVGIRTGNGIDDVIRGEFLQMSTDQEGYLMYSDYALPDTVTAADDGMYMRYNHSLEAVVFDTPAGGGADNWGTQVVQHGTTLTGQGILGNLLDVATDGITDNEIATSAVTTDEILNATILTGDISTGGVTSTNILDGTILTGDIAAGAITTTNILNGTILTGDISTGGVTSSNILDGTIAAVDLSQMGATTNQVLTWNGSAWNPASPSGTLLGALNGLKVSGTDVILGGWLNQNTTISGKNNTNFYNLTIDSMQNFYIGVAKTGHLYRSQLDMASLSAVSYFANQVVSSGVAGLLELKPTGVTSLSQGLASNKAYVSVANTTGATTGSESIIGFTDATPSLDRNLKINNSGFFMKNVDLGIADYDLKYDPTLDEVTYYPGNSPGILAVVEEDFFGVYTGSTGTAQYGWTTSTSGGNVSLCSSTEIVDNHPGISFLESAGVGSGTPLMRMSTPRMYAVSGMTYEALVKVEGFTASNSFFAGLDNGTDYIGFQWDGTGNIELIFANDGTTSTSSTGVAQSDGAWVAVKFVVGATTVDYYINGTLVGNTTLDGTASPGASLPNGTTGDTMQLYFKANTTIASIFKASIDYVKWTFPVSR